MIKNPIVLALISAAMVCLAYFLNNKYNNEDINKSNMIKLSVMSASVSFLTYYFLNIGDSLSLPTQDVLTGDPGF